MNKETNIFLGYIDDKIEQCLEHDKAATTAFLDLKQQSIIKNHCKNMKTVNCDFYGGYAEAERNIAILTPLYWDSHELLAFNLDSDDNPLVLLRATTSKGSRELSHRDYLGSLLGLGVKRETIGDILTDKESVDIVILKEILDFLLLNYNKAGRTDLALKQTLFSNIKAANANVIDKKVSVASLRLDNMISAAFNISRTVAVESIKSGLVFVNHAEASKPDAPVREGDKLVLRGKGKVLVKSIGGRSKKERIYVTFQVWI